VSDHVVSSASQASSLFEGCYDSRKTWRPCVNNARITWRRSGWASGQSSRRSGRDTAKKLHRLSAR
jgi:hypothetical protein